MRVCGAEWSEHTDTHGSPAGLLQFSRAVHALLPMRLSALPLCLSEAAPKGATITGRPCSNAYRFLVVSWRLELFAVHATFLAQAAPPGPQVQRPAIQGHLPPT